MSEMSEGMKIHTFPRDDWELKEGPEYGIFYDGEGQAWLDHCPSCGETWDMVANSWGCPNNCKQLQLQQYHSSLGQSLVNHLWEGEGIEESFGYVSLKEGPFSPNKQQMAYTPAYGVSNFMSGLTGTPDPNVYCHWYTERSKFYFFSTVCHEVAHLSAPRKIANLIKQFESEHNLPSKDLEELMEEKKEIIQKIQKGDGYIAGWEEEIEKFSTRIKSKNHPYLKDFWGNPKKITAKDIDLYKRLIKQCEEKISNMDKQVKEQVALAKEKDQEIANHPEYMTDGEVKNNYLFIKQTKEHFSNFGYGGNEDKRGYGHWMEWRDESEYMFQKGLKGFSHICYESYREHTSDFFSYAKAIYCLPEEIRKKLGVGK